MIESASARVALIAALLSAASVAGLVYASDVAGVGYASIVSYLLAPVAAVLLLRFPSALVALYLSAYTLKRIPLLSGVSQDLTLVLGVLCAGLIAWRFVKGARLDPTATVLILGLCLLVISSMARDLSPYGMEKGLRFVTLTTLAMVAMLTLVSNVRQFLITLVLVSAVLSASAVVLGETSGGRTEVFGDYLMVARQEGLGFVAGVALGGWWTMAGGLGLVGIAVAGARAPFLAALLVPATRLNLRVALAALGGVVILFTPLGAPLHARIGNLGDSYRADTWTRAWEAFSEAPLIGHGSGGFAEWAPDFSFAVVYPHNLVAEIAVEWGAVGLAVVGTFIGWTTILAVRDRGPISLLFLFALMGAMVSGDINGNRPMWAFAAYVIAFRPNAEPLRFRFLSRRRRWSDLTSAGPASARSVEQGTGAAGPAPAAVAHR